MRCPLPRRPLFFPLLGTLLLGPLARAAEPPPAPPQAPPVVTPTPAPPLSDEDREVVENLELLESLDAADALDVLLELEDEEPPGQAP